MGHLFDNRYFCPSLRLLIVSFGQVGRNCRQVAEQATRAFCNSGEIHLCCWRGCSIIIAGANVSRTQCPDARDHERLSAGILKQTIKFACSYVIRCNQTAGFSLTAASELCDEHVMAEAPKIERSQRYTPRGIQPRAMLKTTQQSAGRRIDIHITEARTIGFKQVTFLRQHLCHHNVISDGLHIERHKIVRQTLIHERLAIVLTIFVEA
jgi:hypothetical protein